MLPAGVGTENQYTRQVDIFAFGLATLELATKHKVRFGNTAASAAALALLLPQAQGAAIESVAVPYPNPGQDGSEQVSRPGVKRGDRFFPQWQASRKGRSVSNVGQSPPNAAHYAHAGLQLGERTGASGATQTLRSDVP